MTKSVLIVDQDTGFLESLRDELKSERLEVIFPASLTPVDIMVAFESASVALVDYQTLRSSYFDLVQSCRDRNGLVPIVSIVPKDRSDLGLLAIKSGASDFLQKPCTPGEIVISIKKSLERHDTVSEHAKANSNAKGVKHFSNIVSQSDSMLEIFQTITKIAEYKTTCLVMGESGTGKELIAKAIHSNSSRKDRPFVTVNCGAIPENLLESELFGHVKGSFTGAVKTKKGLFEEADTGTIFLDEIGELPLLLQVKLLRVIQEEEVRKVGDTAPTKINVRIIAATLKDLEKEVEKGGFREDLYYRLNVLPLHIPALRERKEDIPILLEHFIDKINAKIKGHVKGVTPEALQVLMDYDWPGNIRELENSLERAMILVTGDLITIDNLPKSVKTSALSRSAAFVATADELSIKKLSRLLEEDLIVKALKKAKGNRTRAAKFLEISHRALLYKLKKYKLEQKISTPED
ncbi:MAG: sigma-54-dependent Fis family transcriptional regulator [Bdellovibrionales bacterium]|nr:sigma-54-dependent Fis family transcriptional regulator [Bdellovibrionales bacterium]